MSQNQENNKIEKSQTALKEELILGFWKENNVFQKSLEKESPEGDFVFYDGPPYATGEPHYGHLLPGTIKDVIPRYKTMRGFRVARQWGWDCHGLPIENLIEKELGLKSKKEIEAFGIDKFNAAARDSVLRYESTWNEMIPRTGRFVDMANPYMTMTPNYMESVWWVFKSLHDKGLVNKGFKTMHICPRCETPLANFEVNQGYADIKDLTVTAKFKLKDPEKNGFPINTYFLAWTTTPWSLPGNVALVVGDDIDYVKVRSGEEIFIVAKELVSKVFKETPFEILKELKGKDLVGLSYNPPFDYYVDQVENSENGWKVYGADFVTTEDGTGIVHIAPAFGSDDLAVGQKYNLPFIQHVNIRGEFKPEVTDFAGLVVKKKDDSMSADIEIVKYLAGKELLFSKEKITHSYPLCWRCDTPLLNYATDSWFIDVPKIKDRLLANNAKTTWVPEHVRDGRFGKWLEGARDWAVSRSRYWGTPLPVWQKENGDFVVLGGVDELKKHAKKSGNKYIFIRHGEGEHNLKNICSGGIEDAYRLTEKGIAQAEESGEELQSKGITKIIASPFVRTKETAQIVAGKIGFDAGAIETDIRLRELGWGDFNGKQYPEFFAYRDAHMKLFDDKIPNGESYQDVKTRMGEFLYEMESKYQNEVILVVTHGVAFEVVPSIITGVRKVESKKIKDSITQPTGTFQEYDFTPLPHNENYELDLHRPYIDTIELVDEEGNKMNRVEDVFDVWFDSGSMPYAKVHYPFENKDEFEKKFFPANFIAEGQDQTRGWFYTLSVLGTALFDTLPFETVVVNGMVLAEDGKKMSKRLKNYPEISYMLDKYGADAVRLFLMSSPAVHAEDVNFVEKTVGEIASKVIGRLQNSLEFYKLYENGEAVDGWSDHVLDRWIVARIKQSHGEMVDALETYTVDKACRPFFDLIDDLSTWYVRRSRDRFKDEGADKLRALGTMRFVLKSIAQMMAPFTPFVAETVYQSIQEEGSPISVHLTNLPGKVEFDEKIIEDMKSVREIVRLGLEARQKAGIKVRQPLSKLSIQSEISTELLELIADEVNIKQVVFGTEFALDTEITPELKREGDYRELVRMVQDLRKERDLIPSDKISLTLPEMYKEIIVGFEEDLQKTVGADNVTFGDALDLEKI
jgi:isoleucyl-tRNA synthetase